MDNIILDNIIAAEEVHEAGKIERKIYPMNGVKIDKGFYTVFELKRKYDAADKRLILDSDFQRDNVWSATRKCELVESVLMGLPLPIFYFNQDKYGRLIVVDGRQRLTALFSYMDDKYALKGLKILPELNGLKFSQLQSSDYSYYGGALEDFQIHAHVIMPPTPDRIMFDIFDRVNRGGVKLSQQEIRNALYQGKATAFLKQVVESEEFQLATGNAFKNEKRMKDKYLITRFAAEYLWAAGKLQDDKGNVYLYKGDMDELLGKGMDFINHMQEDEIEELLAMTRETLQKSYEYMGEDAFRLKQNGKRSPVNMNVFETIMFIMLSIPPKSENKDYVQKVAMDFLNSKEFRENIGNHRDSALKFCWRIGKAIEKGRCLANGKGENSGR